MQGTQILFYLIFCSGLITIRHHDEEDLLPRHIVSTTRSGTSLSRNARGREHGRLGDPNRSCSLRNGRVASDVFSWQGFNTTSAENWDDIFWNDRSNRVRSHFLILDSYFESYLHLG